MKKSGSPKQLSFQTQLERLADGMEYYAVSVPAKITAAVGTTQAVPVRASINGSTDFIASLYPVGEGRHKLRIKNRFCKEVDIQAGDRVRVKFTVRDRSAEVSIPKDLHSRQFRMAKRASCFA